MVLICICSRNDHWQAWLGSQVWFHPRREELRARRLLSGLRRPHGSAPVSVFGVLPFYGDEFGASPNEMNFVCSRQPAHVQRSSIRLRGIGSERRWVGLSFAGAGWRKLRFVFCVQCPLRGARGARVNGEPCQAHAKFRCARLAFRRRRTRSGKLWRPKTSSVYSGVVPEVWMVRCRCYQG